MPKDVPHGNSFFPLTGLQSSSPFSRPGLVRLAINSSKSSPPKGDFWTYFLDFQGIRSASSSGRPERIFSTFDGGWRSSPS
jgi:hypothetical protein